MAHAEVIPYFLQPYEVVDIRLFQQFQILDDDSTGLAEPSSPVTLHLQDSDKPGIPMNRVTISCLEDSAVVCVLSRFNNFLKASINIVEKSSDWTAVPVNGRMFTLIRFLNNKSEIGQKLKEPNYEF